MLDGKMTVMRKSLFYVTIVAILLLCMGITSVSGAGRRNSVTRNEKSNIHLPCEGIPNLKNQFRLHQWQLGLERQKANKANYY